MKVTHLGTGQAWPVGLRTAPQLKIQREPAANRGFSPLERRALAIPV